MAGKPLTTGRDSGDAATVIRCLFPSAANEDEEEDDDKDAEDLTKVGVGDVDVDTNDDAHAGTNDNDVDGGGGGSDDDDDTDDEVGAESKGTLHGQIQPFPLCVVRKCFLKLRSCSS
jgi:hypothetical protein